MQIWHGAAVFAAVFTTVQDIQHWTPKETLARLNDRCADVRADAAYLGGSFGGPAAIDRLITLLRNDPFPDVPTGAVIGLYASRSEPVYQATLAALDDPDAVVVGEAARSVGDFEDGRASTRLLDLTEHSNGLTRKYAQGALAALVGRGLVRDAAIVKRLTALLTAQVQDTSLDGRYSYDFAVAAFESMHRNDLIPPDAEAQMRRPVPVAEPMAYEIPEGYRGVLTLDSDTPGCAPLKKANGAIVARFDAKGYACTSTYSASMTTDAREYWIDASDRARSGPQVEIRGVQKTPLPASTRLPAPSTLRTTAFLGSDVDFRAMRGCK